MKISLPWGSDALTLQAPDSWQIVHPEPIATVTRPTDELDVVRAALAQPAAQAPLRTWDLAGKRILIISDDNTRPTPVHRFMPLILQELQQAGADLSRVLLMPALGIHSPMTEAEMAAKVGAQVLERVQWRNHNAFAADELAHVGRTTRGTPVRLNKAVVAADVIITLGLIEPHLWAGFGGGLKNIVPGVAAADTIGLHHEIIAEPPYRFNRVGMAPEENSFRLDLEEVQDMLRAPIFCLNVTIDHKGRILGAFAGDPVAAHRQGVDFNRRLAGRRLPQQVDGILVNSFPMDINFKQSMKCVGNSLPALQPGGVVMAFMRAERGVDDLPVPQKATPLPIVKRLLRLLGPARVRWFLEKVRPGQNVEEKFLTYYSMQLIRGYELYFHVPTLSEYEVRQFAFFENFTQPQDVIRKGLKKLGPQATVAVFPEAGATFPLVGA